MPHPDDVDLSSISTYENFSVSFDYKYSTVNFESSYQREISVNMLDMIQVLWRIVQVIEMVRKRSETSIPKFFYRI
jgi:hypothetical protein